MEHFNQHSTGRDSPATFSGPNTDDKAFVRDNVYQMVAEPRGQVLVINNANHAEAQNGGDNYREDGERLMTTFKSLGFAVYKSDQFYDLSRRRMEKLLRKFANSKLHKFADACVVVFLTHGNFRDGVYAADGWKIAFEDIVKLFGESEVLYRKPKIFIFDGMHGGGNPDRGVSPPTVASDDVRETHGYGVEARRRVDTGIHSPTLRNNSDSIRSSPSSGRNNAQGDVHYITHNREEQRQLQTPLAAGADMVFIYNCMHPYRAVHTQDARFIHVLCDTIDENASNHDLLAILTIVNRRLGSQPSSYMNEFQQSCFTSSLHKLLYFNRGYFENTPLLSDDSDISIGAASHSMSPRLAPRRDHHTFQEIATSSTASSLSPHARRPAPPRPPQQSVDQELLVAAAPETVREDLYEEYDVETDEGKQLRAAQSPVAITTTTTTTKEVVVEQVLPQKNAPTTVAIIAHHDDAARPASSLKDKLMGRLSRSEDGVSTTSESSSASSVESGGDGGDAAKSSRTKNRDVAGRTKSLEMSADDKIRHNQPDTTDNRQQNARQTLPASPTTVYNAQTTTNHAEPSRPRRRSDDGGRGAPMSSSSPQQKKKKRSFLRRLFGMSKKDKKNVSSSASTSSAATSATLPAARPITPVATVSSQQHTLPATIREPKLGDDDYPYWIHSSPQPARRSNRSLGRDGQQSPVQTTFTEETTVLTKTAPSASPTKIIEDQREVDQPFRRVVLDQQNPNLVTTFPPTSQTTTGEEDEVFTKRTPHNSGLFADQQQQQQVVVESYSVTNVTTKLPDNEREAFVVPHVPAAPSFEATNEKFVVNTAKGNSYPHQPRAENGQSVQIENEDLRTTQLSPDVEVEEQKIYRESSSGDSGRRTPFVEQYQERKETFPLTSPKPVEVTPALSTNTQFFGTNVEHHPNTTTYERTEVVQEEELPLYTSSTPGQFVQRSTSSSVSTASPTLSPRGEKPPVPTKNEGLVSNLREKLGLSSGNNSGNRTPTTPTSSPTFDASNNDNVILDVIDEPSRELLYQPVVDEAGGETTITTAAQPVRSASPTRPVVSPSLWFGHDPPRSPDTAEVRTVTEVTTTTTTEVIPPTSQQPSQAILVEQNDGLYSPAPDDTIDARPTVAEERSTSSEDDVKRSKSPISWLNKKPTKHDDLRVRTITTAQVPVLQSNIPVSEDLYASESVEGRATPTGLVAYGSTVRRRDSDVSTSGSETDEKTRTKTKRSDKIKDFFTGGSSTKTDARESNDNDRQPRITPVLEPVLSHTKTSKEMTVSSTQLNPVEKERQENENYDRAIYVTERQLSSPVNKMEERPRVEPVLLVGQRPLRDIENVEQRTVVSPADEQLYKVKEVEVENEVQNKHSPIVGQYLPGISHANDEQSPRATTPTTGGGAMSKLKEAFFGSSRSPSHHHTENASDETNAVQQSNVAPASPPYITTTTTTHTAASTMVVPVNNSTPTGSESTYFELNQQPIGFKASVLPQYPPDYSYSSSSNAQNQQRELETATNVESSNEQRRPEQVTVEVLRETVVKQTIPDEESRPSRAASRGSEYVTPRSSTNDDGEENLQQADTFHTPQNYRTTSERDNESDDEGHGQPRHSSYGARDDNHDYSLRTPTNSTSTTRYYDDSHDDQSNLHTKWQPGREFENESQREAYLAHLRHIELEEKVIKKREEEDFAGRRVPELVQRFESIASSNSSAAEKQYYPNRSQTSSASPTKQQYYENERESDASLSPNEQRRANILIERSESAIAQQQHKRHGPRDGAYAVEEQDEDEEIRRGVKFVDDDQQRTRRYEDGRRHLQQRHWNSSSENTAAADGNALPRRGQAGKVIKLGLWAMVFVLGVTSITTFAKFYYDEIF